MDVFNYVGTHLTHMLPHAPPFSFLTFTSCRGGEFAENTKIIRSLLTLDTSVPTFVCGDMNFVENASDSTSRDPTLPTREFQEVWEAFKTRFGVLMWNTTPTPFFTSTQMIRPQSTPGPLGWTGSWSPWM